MELSKYLKPQYFWDVDISDHGNHISKRLIIERVFSFGNMKEIKFLIDYYGKKEIIEVLCKLNYLDPKTSNFASKLFNKPKKSFRCYTRKQLMTQHWDS
jgi:hypothetical protein